jgi:hypothetical protein
MVKNLTETQVQVIKHLFGAAMGDVKKAAAACGVENIADILTDEFVEAIRKRGDGELSLSIPRAIYVIQQMLSEDPSQATFYSEKLHKVATDLLDRAGISKQERSSSGGMTVGLIFMPDKRPLSAPPVTIDMIAEPVAKLAIENG